MALSVTVDQTVQVTEEPNYCNRLNRFLTAGRFIAKGSLQFSGKFFYSTFSTAQAEDRFSNHRIFNLHCWRSGIIFIYVKKEINPLHNSCWLSISDLKLPVSVYACISFLCLPTKEGGILESSKMFSKDFTVGLQRTFGNLLLCVMAFTRDVLSRRHQWN